MGFHHFYVAWEKWSGQNRISHPHWVKICDNHNGQINLCAKQKYKVLSATEVLLGVCGFVVNVCDNLAIFIFNEGV